MTVLFILAVILGTVHIPVALDLIRLHRLSALRPVEAIYFLEPPFILMLANTPEPSPTDFQWTYIAILFVSLSSTLFGLLKIKRPQSRAFKS